MGGLPAKTIGLCGFVVCLWFGAFSEQPQRFSKADRDMVARMLQDAAADVQKSYYDPKLHGLDWDARVHQAKENIEKADSTDSAVSEIAALLDSLNDSHTRLILPPRSYDHE